MKIALDYDKTFTLDPEAWLAFVDFMRGRGHDVRIVTARDDRFDRTLPLLRLEQAGLVVIYTRGIGKDWFLRHFGLGFYPDVWVDDKPVNILNNSATAPEDLAKWREERDEGPAYISTEARLSDLRAAFRGARASEPESIAILDGERLSDAVPDRMLAEPLPDL